MQRLTVRTLLMPVTTLVVLTVTAGLILFGTRATPVIALTVALIFAGAALLVRYGRRRLSEARPDPDRHAS